MGLRPPHGAAVAGEHDMKLMVSHDCGMSYHEVKRGARVSRLLKKARKMHLNERWLRWTIESDDGQDFYAVTPIFTALVNTITLARAAEAGGE